MSAPDRLELDVVDGDIALLDVGAVVNAANDMLWMGSGVAGAIKRAGGEEIEHEAMAKGPIPVGTAVVTRGGRLAAPWVIHAAVMGQDLRTDEELIRRATREVLEIADRLGCETIALPAFGTGVGGFPLAACAGHMADVVARHRPQSLRRVIFAVHGEEARAAFAGAVAEVVESPPARSEGAGEIEIHDD